MILPAPPLLVITDRHQARGDLVERAAALFAGGCRWLSLREKDLPPSARLALLERLVTTGARWGATIMVHDDVEAAVASGAGLHLPAHGSAIAARRRLGGDALIGRSAHSRDEILAAARDGCDYATLSPIFITASKPGYGPALGAAALRGPWPIPVLALGGIDARNLKASIASGAAGAAVMGGAMRAPDPRAFMAALLAASDAAPCPVPNARA